MVGVFGEIVSGGEGESRGKLVFFIGSVKWCEVEEQKLVEVTPNLKRKQKSNNFRN